MSVAVALRSALAVAGVDADAVATSPLSGGCIHRVVRLDLDDGRALVAKSSDAPVLPIFQEEAASLRAIEATATLPVPRVLECGIHHGEAILLMTLIPSAAAGPAGWRRFGVDLAAMHAADAGSRYGFETDNHLGSTPQPNSWCDDWVEFNAAHRIGHQLALACREGRLALEVVRLVEMVVDRLDSLIPRRPRPGLLHGDLWSGNAIPTGGDRVAVIDPACSIGDGWADIAMMQLFGGFPESCVDAYAEAAGAIDRDDMTRRLGVYQLYHLLNHVNLFGGGYTARAAAVARALTR